MILDGKLTQLCALTLITTCLNIACGYRLPDETLSAMQEYLDSKNLQKTDVNALLLAIKWYKDQQLNSDIEGDVDEYLDAFVALGGQPDKDGYISKDVLVEIIKAEFELTINMVVSKITIAASRYDVAIVRPSSLHSFE